MAHFRSLLSNGLSPRANASQANTNAPGTPPGVASASSSSNSTPDANYGALDDDASLLLQMEAATRAPRLGDEADLLSPIAQTALGESMEAGSNVTGTMDATGATANLLGEHGGSAFLPNVTAPRTTQSPDTQAIQRAMRDSAIEYVHNHSGAFSSIETVVDTVNDDGDSLGEEIGPTNLNTALSNASNVVNIINNPNIGRCTVDTSDPVNDPNQAGNIIVCGPLGAQSGTPVVGSNGESNEPFFGPSSVDDVVVVGEETPLDPNTMRSSYSVDRSMTNIIPPSTSSRIQFGEDTMHTYSASDPPGLPSSPSAAPPSQTGTTSLAGTNSGNNLNIGNGGSGADNNGNGAGDAGNGAGDTRDGNDPNNAGDDTDPIEKLVFTYRMMGGPVSAWGLTGRFPVASVAHVQNRLVASRGLLI